jgi:hypothetical protein
MFIIIYARVVDNKKKGLEMEGPFLGPECETMDKVHEACRAIVNPSKDTVLIRTYDLNEFSYEGAKEKAGQCFDLLFDHMISAATMCDRPKRKRLKD